MRSIVYHQNFSFVYHQADSFLCTPKGVMRYKGDVPPLMIYTLKRDDIPSLSALIKKSKFQKGLGFFVIRVRKRTG